MNHYNYVDALNGRGALETGIPTGLTLASRYGMPVLFQQARDMRLFVF